MGGVCYMYIVAMYTFRWWDDCHAICLDVFSFSCNLFCLMNSFHFICFLPPSPFPLFLPRTTSTTTTTTHSPTPLPTRLTSLLIPPSPQRRRPRRPAARRRAMETRSINPLHHEESIES